MKPLYNNTIKRYRTSNKEYGESIIILDKGIEIDQISMDTSNSKKV